MSSLIVIYLVFLACPQDKSHKRASLFVVSSVSINMMAVNPAVAMLFF